MQEVIRHFENMAVWFDPWLLAVFVLAGILVGLFLWLAGLLRKDTSCALLGVWIGSFCGFFVIGRSVLSAGLLSACAAIVSTTFKRPAVATIAALLTAFLVFAVQAKPYFDDSSALKRYSEYHIQGINKPIGFIQTQDAISIYIISLDREAHSIFSQMPARKLAIAGGVGLLFLAAGYFFHNIVLAACCGMLGTVLIFAGTVFALSWRGMAPVSYIYARPLFFCTGLAAAIALSTASQILLLNLAEKKKKAKDFAGGSNS